MSPMIPRFTSAPPFDSEDVSAARRVPHCVWQRSSLRRQLNHPKGGGITPLRRFKGVSGRSARLPTRAAPLSNTGAEGPDRAEWDAGSLDRASAATTAARLLTIGNHLGRSRGRGAASAGHLDGRDL